MKYKQYENEIDKKRKDEDKIELMTQFMLDQISSEIKLIEKMQKCMNCKRPSKKTKKNSTKKKPGFESKLYYKIIMGIEIKLLSIFISI